MERDGQVELFVPGHDGVVGAAGGHVGAALDGGDQDLPPGAGVLEGVEVEGDEVVEEDGVALSAEDVQLGAQDVEGVAVAAGWAVAVGTSARPLSGCWGE